MNHNDIDQIISDLAKRFTIEDVGTIVYIAARVLEAHQGYNSDVSALDQMVIREVTTDGSISYMLLSELGEAAHE